jgi:hypothetical protein
VRAEPFLPTLLRSGLVIGGLLLLGVGLADIVAGHTKVAEYQQVLSVERAAAARAGDASRRLFPASSETAQRVAIAEAKLGYYGLLVLVGQMLTAAGLVLVAVGAVRERRRALRAAPSRLAPRHSR